MIQKLNWQVFLCAALLTLFYVFAANYAEHTSVAAPVAPSAQNQESSFRILLGLRDSQPTHWDGSLSVSHGTVARLEPWRPENNDSLQGTSRWRISTHELVLQPIEYVFLGIPPPVMLNGKYVFSGDTKPVVANGVVATFSRLALDSTVQVNTIQGNFQFRPGELTHGSALKLLGGSVMVDRVPPSQQVTQPPGDHDYPAAGSDREGNVWVAYVKFSPNPKFLGIRTNTPQPVTDFDALAEPTGGDQVFLVCYSGGVWGKPTPVSEPQGDVYRPAVAVDGEGRVWVFWSSNHGGNSDLYARSFKDGQGGDVSRLTADRGADLTPVATSDARGRVWVAWQAFRGGRGEIHAVRQEGAGYSAEMVVAASASNEWNPAIAASASGEVTIAWDSYRKGDYDVYMRTYDATGHAGEEKPVAATRRYEAYPTLAYDPSGRLWVAWEESDEGWGKDWGAYETSGTALYQGRWVKLRVFQNGQAFSAGNLGAALPGIPTEWVDSITRQDDAQFGLQPNPDEAKERKPSWTPVPTPRPFNSLPRLFADRSGRIWLAYRTKRPLWWSRAGGVWFENVVSYDGNAWSDPIFITHSDNLLDNRPALASTAAGELLVIGSSDGRQLWPIYSGPDSEKEINHNALFASRILMSPSVQPARLSPVIVETLPPATSPENAAVERLRRYRVSVDGTEYRILRGEFHRHTEVSVDGLLDGTLWDTWRYALDAAALDWIGCCDHDNGEGREYSWWTNQKLDDVFLIPGVFTPMFSYERSVSYPEGHRNIVMARRGVRTLPRLPKVDEKTPGSAPDTRMLYEYLRHFDGIVGSHTSATDMGTDWRDNDPQLEPVVEIYQGDRNSYEMPEAPRANSPHDSLGGYQPKGFVSRALDKGFRLSFEASSDHLSTHMSYCNLYATGTTREAVMAAFKKRHVYASTANILADVQCGGHMMGDEFESKTLPALHVKLIGTGPIAGVHIIKDGRYVYASQPNATEVEFTWRDEVAGTGKTSYYYVRAEQQDGEIVWASPMWIKYLGE